MTHPIISLALSTGRRVLNEVDSKHVLASVGIPVIPTRAATSADEAAAIGLGVGYPVAAKVLADGISHKSDVGGVKLNLEDDAAVLRAWGELEGAARAVTGATFEGVSIQPMALPGLELLLGARRDAQFGPVVTLGLGGVFVELLDDVVVRLAPVSDSEATEMMDELRASRVLDGFRGSPPIDRAAIARALSRLGDLMVGHPEISEVDVNPLFCYPDGVLAIDARIVLSGETARR
ncbi:MAG: acetate--CoA ligase family protein [Chloroflexota bacterium]